MYHHSLAILDDELLVIGGKVSEATNVVYTFRDTTPCYSLSTLSHVNRLQLIIAARGTIRRTRDGECEQTVVRIYMKESNPLYKTNFPSLVHVELDMHETGCHGRIHHGTRKLSWFKVHQHL